MSTIDLPALNVPLLKSLVTWAAADQAHLDDLAARFKEEGWGHWDQERWAKEVRNGHCQTAYCIAGQAAAQVGYAPVFDAVALPYLSEVENGDVYITGTCAPRRFAGLGPTGMPVYEPNTDAGTRQISDVGREAIGLSYDEANALFEGSNSLQDILAMALMFARVRNVDLDLDPALVDMVNEHFGSLDRATAAEVNRFHFERDYVDMVLSPEWASGVLRKALEYAHDDGEISDTEFEAAYDLVASR